MDKLAGWPLFSWLDLRWSSAECYTEHDAAALIVQTGLLVGILLSYVPQHLRIILERSSEGFSPWFLLLGVVSGSSGFLNVAALQWESVKCCKVVSALSCYESLGGIEIVGFQWLSFTLILVLFLIYFPPHLKYSEYRATAHPGHPKNCECEPCEAARLGPQISTTPEWKLAVTLGWVCFIHFAFGLFITFVLLRSGPTPDGEPSDGLYLWATFLGLTSSSLALIQYAPQLWYTYRTKLVGALSIPSMCIQSPGAALMVWTIASKPGTNWTSWLVYVIAGVMQGSLLIMCIFWKVRQHRLGVDDFGNPLPDAPSDAHFQHHTPHPSHSPNESVAEPIYSAPALGAGVEQAPEGQQDAVADAVRDALETTPLLPSTPGGRKEAGGRKGFLGLFGR